MARAWISGDIRWTDKDKGWSELLKRLGRRVDGISLSVGVQGEEAAKLDDRTGKPLGEVAGINEYGAPNAKIPPRPFLGTAAEAHGLWRKEMAAAVAAVVDGADSFDAAKAVGRKAVEDVQKIIDTGTGRFPPNADSTVLRKGHNHPLIDDPENPELRNAVTAYLLRGKNRVG